MNEFESTVKLLDEASDLAKAGRVSLAAKLIAGHESHLPQDSIHYTRFQIFEGLSLVNLGKYAEGMKLLIPNVDKIEKSAYQIEAIKPLSFIGFSLAVMGNPEAGLVWAGRAVNLAEKFDDKLLYISTLSALGSIHYEQNDYYKAMDSYLKAVDLGREIGENHFSTSLSNLGHCVVSKLNGKKDELSDDEKEKLISQGFDYFEEAKAIAQKCDNNLVYVLAITGIANLYFYQGRLEEAEEQVQQAMSIAESTDSSVPELANTMGNIKAAQGMYEEAMEWYKQIIDAKIDTHDTNIEAYNGLVKTCFEVRNIDMARKWSKELADYMGVYYKNRLASMANTTSLVIEAQKIQERAIMLEEELNILSVIGELGIELSTTREVVKIVKSLRLHMDSLIKPSSFAVFLLQDEFLVPITIWEEDRELDFPGVHIDDRNSITANCARARESILINSPVDAKKRFTSGAIPGTKKMGSSLFSPLIVGERLIGVMTAQSEQSGFFGAREQSVFSSIASYAAIALDNAIAYRELEEANQKIQENMKHLVNAERMASLGRLTASIAHEINTPLGTMRASIASARKLTEEYSNSIADPDITDDDHREIASELIKSLNLADSAGEKASSFVRNIKGKTRDLTEISSYRFNPIDVLNETLPLLAPRLMEKKAIITVSQPDNNVFINGKPSRFNQVVDNLIENAIDALPQENGEIHINFSHSADGIIVTIGDNGMGMDSDTLKHAFDPLFTTKPVGQGTGLGLSIVNDIIQGDFRGNISCESEPGKGTKMIIQFPVAMES